MRPMAPCAATGRFRFLERRRQAGAMSLAVVVGLALVLSACGGGDDASKAPTIAKGGAQMQVTGKVAGTMVISGSVNCAADGSSDFIAGNVGSLPVSLSIGRAKAGQTYTFPQAPGTLGAFITFVATGTPSSTWIAGSDDQPGKGTATITATGGSIDLDLTSAVAGDGTEHVSGSWTCAG